MSNSEQTILSDVNVFRRHPSPQDVTELQALIATNESSLASLNEEMEACSRSLNALRAQFCTHTLTIRKCRAAMTLARLLPPELLAKIFEHASGMGWTRAPIVASHVCSTWRAAARAHPSVWSYITINFDLQDRTGWTKHWLSMARQASLHVTLEYSVYNRAFGRVMALLFERSEQWVSLDLDMPPEETQLVLIACKPHNFTRLRSIHTSLYACSEGLEDTERFTSFADAFQNAPSLTSFSVFGNALPRDLPLGLTSICMEYNDPFGPNVENPHSVLEVLRNLPNLESLTMRLGVLTPTPPAFPGVELPELRTLVYEDLHAGDFQILSYLAAPSLRHLRACIQSGPEVCDVVPTYLIPFLEDSPNVETLELDGIDVWPARWLSILPRLPKLRELYLHDSDIDDKAIGGMFGKNGSCPDLQRIDLRWCQHVRGTTLAQLVESRVNSGGREIDEVATIGCSLVRKQDAMQIARFTTFRVVIGERDEHCRERRCCDNERYRQRLKFHLLTLSAEERAGIRLVLD